MGAATPEQQLSAIQLERRRWEAERDRERERLLAEAARLADAWQRLESEQRRVLAQRNAGGSARVGSRSLGRNAPGAPEPIADQEPLTPEMAAMQFQQLRREVQRHTERCR
jgi:hypothetical protein